MTWNFIEYSRNNSSDIYSSNGAALDALTTPRREAARRLWRLLLSHLPQRSFESSIFASNHPADRRPTPMWHIRPRSSH